MRLRLSILLALAWLSACQQIERAIPVRKAIPELAYAGDRPDAPPLEERGNAVFTDAAYDDRGTLLVTLPCFGSARMQVWDAATGALLSGIDASVPNPGSRITWMIDGARRRLLGTGPGHFDTGYALYDLMSGQVLGRIDEGGDPKRPAFAVGLTEGNAEVLLFKPGWMEVWRLDPIALSRRAPSPFNETRYFPTCVGGIPATYNDKTCWEWSADRRHLAVAFTPETPVRAPTSFMEIDVATLEVMPLELPATLSSRPLLASFAYSPDNRWLAVGTQTELLLWNRQARTWSPPIPGDHKRNRLLGPMRFSPDSRRVIALGDQLQISVFDVATGALVGRHEPEFENWEGELKVSADGSRMLVYTFVSDTFEVLDGADARRLGWVCPYFCNVRHNPVQPPYAVSPDGASVAISHRRGAAVWDTATDSIRFALRDARRKQLPHPYQR
jgi:hypothetical protein